MNSHMTHFIDRYICAFQKSAMLNSITVSQHLTIDGIVTISFNHSDLHEYFFKLVFQLKQKISLTLEIAIENLPSIIHVTVDSNFWFYLLFVYHFYPRAGQDSHRVLNEWKIFWRCRSYCGLKTCIWFLYTKLEQTGKL